MKSKVLASFEEAVGDVPDGASILLGGFGPGTPHNLIRALYFQGASGLSLIANTAGAGGVDGLITPENLIADGRVRKVTLAFTAATHPSRQSVLERLNDAGRDRGGA